MPVYMLDTDISSYIMKRSHAAVLRRLESVKVTEVSISAITKCELLYGVEVSPQRQRDDVALREFLRHVEVLDLPDGAALDYARIRADLKLRGALIGANDLLIAAHALSLGLILVTNNTGEFERVKGLRVENWTQPSV
jgi:tRNA(fMet)-specific endonuclease VapC